MLGEAHPEGLLGAYVVDTCLPGEAAAITEHASRCSPCADEIARLVGVTEWMDVTLAAAPPPALRARVLAAAALAARPASRTQVGQYPAPDQGRHDRRLIETYRLRVVELNHLLTGLDDQQWQLPAWPYRSVRDVVVHLQANDALVASALGVHVPVPHDGTPPSQVRSAWRQQADATIQTLGRGDAELLERPARLAGRAGARAPVRDALVQRGLETWIHTDDTRTALHLPVKTPEAAQLSDTVRFVLRLLPTVMDVAGRSRSGEAVRLVLTGDGGSSQVVGLSAADPGPGTVVAEVSMPAVHFCRLVASRVVDGWANIATEGSTSAVNDVLVVLAAMGCE